ncbi:MAG: N-acetylmuramoyl-L-alanine amidase, partial [Nocardioidaceae bacterium]
MRADPVTPRVREVPVPDVDRSGSPRLAAVSAPQPVPGFGVVGATWRGGEPGNLDLQVRTKEAGSWSGWQRLPFDAEHGPDPGSAEARAATRTGSDPVVVGDVGMVQLRATSASGAAPRDLELSVVDPGQAQTDAADTVMTTSTLGAASTSAATPAATSAASEATAATSAATSVESVESVESVLFGGSASPAVRAAAGVSNPAGVRAPRPRIRTRRAWGANERLRSGRPSYGTVRAGFVHHTVNANGYRRAQVPAIIRGIYAFHTQSNGWSDIGYNFLVDRFGRIWQGRFGDLRRNVIGAHTLGYNHVSFAMSAIGNFETARPSAPMLRAY